MYAVTNSFLPQDKKHSVTVVPHEIEPYYSKKRAEPNLAVSNTIVEKAGSEKLAKFSDILSILARFCSSSSEQAVPGWAGRITLTSSNNDETKRQSTVDYISPVNSTITENATIQHIIKLSQAASREMQQQYTVLTFELPKKLMKFCGRIQIYYAVMFWSGWVFSILHAHTLVH